MFQIFPENLRIPFMAIRWPTAFISLAVVGFSIFLLSTKGLNYGVDFAGGAQMVIQFNESVAVDEEALRKAVSDIGLTQASVQRFGTDFEAETKEYIVHFSGDFASEEVVQKKISEALSQSGTPAALVHFRFSGMEKAYLKLTENLPANEIEKLLRTIKFDLLQIDGVSAFGNSVAKEYELRFGSVADMVATALNQKFKTDSVPTALTIEKLDFVGAKVGSDLKTSAVLSVLIALALIFLYVFLRFDFAFAPGVVIALAHDVIITAGLFSLFQFEFDLTTVAALLAVAGYSVNDTIIVFDRIREMIAEYKGKDLAAIIDLAINQTLNRTIITSGTTLAATLILWVYGGAVIHGFAFALTAGIFVGTYSSIFVASTLLLFFHKWQNRTQKDAKHRVAAA
ncbi:MAG: protein translocase subunit SecF [Deltaproteobacteria bacterium CG11_big_fil_rev_8_21_14_0_20_45_16]|nr:MAG: protein translocase subunit SecF [Deltaproteobacteria bacterium CG11_big_fil_rev_8_21_14_0_20_45_16]